VLDALDGEPAGDPEDARLMAELLREEGFREHAYQDHLGYWTIGIGRLIDKRKGGRITRAEAEYLKRNDVAKVRAQLDERLPWWRHLDAVRQRALQNMAFQLGIGGLMGFKASLAAIRARNWATAAANLRKSKWARQTPARAARVIKMIETGKA
jgi:lysozyme